MCDVQVDGTVSTGRPVTAGMRPWGDWWAPPRGHKLEQVTRLHMSQTKSFLQKHIHDYFCVWSICSIYKVSAPPHRAAFLSREKKLLLNERDSWIHVCVSSLAEFAFIFLSQLWFFPSSHQGTPCVFMTFSLSLSPTLALFLSVCFTLAAGAAATGLFNSCM